jgi:hypothetical protein
MKEQRKYFPSSRNQKRETFGFLLSCPSLSPLIINNTTSTTNMDLSNDVEELSILVWQIMNRI